MTERAAFARAADVAVELLGVRVRKPAAAPSSGDVGLDDQLLEGEEAFGFKEGAKFAAAGEDGLVVLVTYEAPPNVRASRPDASRD